MMMVLAGRKAKTGMMVDANGKVARRNCAGMGDRQAMVTFRGPVGRVKIRMNIFFTLATRPEADGMFTPGSHLEVAGDLCGDSELRAKMNPLQTHAF